MTGVDTAAALAGLDDRELAGLLDAGTTLGAGIGGRTARVDVGGVPVFVKRIPLTDLERQHPGSTANLFGLPTWYQYGVGSTGFGAWRELAAHTSTSGTAPHFPLLYHWRVLPSEPAPVPYLGDWDGHPAVARRVEAMTTATAAIVLFLQYLPMNLHEWLLERFAAGDGERAVALADRELHTIVGDLRERGMVHFDAHPNNVLTDGRRLCLGDFGLALDRSFELSGAEAAFLELHRDWDAYDVQRYLSNWLTHRGHTTELVERYAPTVALMNDFYGRLVAGPKSTPYPLPFHPVRE